MAAVWRSRSTGLALSLQFLAFAAFLFGVKLWLIHGYGNATPFWDQWDAEAAGLYEPFLQGRLTWHDLFAAHNEHRILTTRLLGLLLLSLNEGWSPLLEMVVNAALHVAALAVAVGLVAKSIGDVNRSTSTPTVTAAMLAFTAVLFAVPFGWENTLAGFQAQFYFVLLFGVWSIWLLLRNPAFSAGWWAGAILGVAAYFSLVAGLFAILAVIGTFALRCMVISTTRREVAGAVSLLAIFIAGALLTPDIAQHTSPKATSVAQLTGAMAKALAWPSRPSRLSGQWLAALVRNMPWLVFVVVVLWRRTPRTGAQWFLVAMGIWIAVQVAGVSYGRAAEILSSRYLDLHSMALLINFAALVSVLGMASDRWRGLLGCVCAVWLVLVLVAAYGLLRFDIPANLHGKKASSLTQEANLRSYLSSGDRSAMQELPPSHLPYPVAERLAGILASAAVRDILPGNLQAPLAAASITGEKGAFRRDAAFPGSIDCECRFISSYSSDGGVGRGDMRLQYQPQFVMAGPRTMEIKVAGYPTAAGRIEIEQNGIVREVRIAHDPGEHWMRIHLSVASGPFDIHLVDESPSAWFAVSDPVPAGRLDPVLARLLAGWSKFLAMSSALLCLIMVLSIPSRRTVAPPLPSTEKIANAT